MNDRFKFRAWNKREDCYIDPQQPTPLLQSDGVLAYFSNNPEAMNFYDIEFCTGLKDKNGKLIYEGDILGYFDNKIAVVWNNKNPSFELIGLDDTRYGKLSQEYVDSFGFKIIGNIHEKESK